MPSDQESLSDYIANREEHNVLPSVPIVQVRINDREIDQGTSAKIMMMSLSIVAALI